MRVGTRLFTAAAFAPLVLAILLYCAPTASAAQFTDVPDTFWAAEDISLCVEKGFMGGESATAFEPSNPLERGQFISILSRFFGWGEASPLGLPYRDVMPGDWFAGALAAAYQHGAVTSQTETFRPHDPVTREELAVTLVRALGYQSIAGLAEAVPFSDVTTNTGYLGMAHHLGLMNGSGGVFLPSNKATRAQTAAVLARLYRKLHGIPPRCVGIAASLSDLEGRSGLDAAAVQAVRLSSGIGLSLIMSRENADLIRNAAQAMGAETLLCAEGETLYRESISLLLEEAMSYDGIFLNLTSVPDEGYLRQLRESMGGKRLYLVVPSPAVGSLVPYEALAESADVLVVRISGAARLTMESGFPVDPVEPLDGMYDALRLLAARIEAGKVSIMLSTSGNLWTGGRNAGTISGQEVETLLASPGVRASYSDRYECAYLSIPASGNQEERVVWYLDAKAVQSRLRLARLFGTDGVCLTLRGTGSTVWSVLG